MSNHPRLVVLVFLASACGGKGGSSSAAADSTATSMDSGAVMAPADSLGAARDSLSRRDSATRGDSANATDSSKTIAKPRPEMAFDSAFGPKYMVDSTGKLIPIRPKKP